MESTWVPFIKRRVSHITPRERPVTTPRGVWLQWVFTRYMPRSRKSVVSTTGTNAEQLKHSRAPQRTELPCGPETVRVLRWPFNRCPSGRLASRDFRVTPVLTLVAAAHRTFHGRSNFLVGTISFDLVRRH
jgi:hypothetical protein